MKVLIDDREFVPKDETFIEVHGVQYHNVAHWLYNIQANLISKWVKTIKAGEKPDFESKEYKELKEFEYFMEKYLRFKDDGQKIVEINNDEME